MRLERMDGEARLSIFKPTISQFGAGDFLFS
jgi:hypothetical protein